MGHPRPAGEGRPPSAPPAAAAPKTALARLFRPAQPATAAASSIAAALATTIASAPLATPTISASALTTVSVAAVAAVAGRGTVSPTFRHLE